MTTLTPETTTPERMTREEIEKAKSEWLRDDCYDLQDVAEHPEDKAELRAFQEERYREWEAKKAAAAFRTRVTERANSGGPLLFRCEQGFVDLAYVQYFQRQGDAWLLEFDETETHRDSLTIRDPEIVKRLEEILEILAL